MLPTPDTSHVPYERVYEPAEDSFLLLDTLSSASETAFLSQTFSSNTGSRGDDDIHNAAAPLVVEVGTGSGVVIGFINAHAQTIFGTRDILTAGVDMNVFACKATVETARKAVKDNPTTHACYLGSCMGDLTSSWRPGEIDVLVFNPPYVPTLEMPSQPAGYEERSVLTVHEGNRVMDSQQTSFEEDSYLLSLSYAGGKDGMETTDRLIASLPRLLSKRGCAYILFCHQNRPDAVKERMLRDFGTGWNVSMVGSSGKTAGREKLQVLRIWREREPAEANAERDMV